MKFAGFASLMLAACLSVNSATAGMLLIDDFTGASGIADARATNSNTTVDNSAPGTINFRSNLVGNFVTGDQVADVSYSFASGALDLSGYDSVKLQGITDFGGFDPLDAGLLVTDGANTQATIFSWDGTGSELTFDLSSLIGGGGPVDLSNITALSVGFGDAGFEPFSFKADQLIAFSAMQGVPEPATMALIGVVGAGGGLAGWRKRRNAAAC